MGGKSCSISSTVLPSLTVLDCAAVAASTKSSNAAVAADVCIGDGAGAGAGADAVGAAAADDLLSYYAPALLNYATNVHKDVFLN